MEDKKKEAEILSEQDVWDVLKYAQAAAGLGSTLPISIDVINQTLKNISLMDTGDVTESQVSEALSAPKDNEEELRRISESFEITSSLYKRLLSYMGGIPAFDWTYTCRNAEKKDYAKPSYKKDLKVFQEFMSSFDHKQEFGKVVKQLFRNEAHFSVFRDEGKKFVLQELPPNRAKITGKFDFGMLFSFDYHYFLTPGINIDFYPAVFKKTLAQLNKNKIDAHGYQPSQSINLRGKHGFAQWVDCSPVDGFWCFKLSPEIITRIPYFAGMFPDVVNEGTIRELQKSSYIASASKIITGQVPMLQNKASTKDMISITPDLLGKFLALVKSAINSDAVKIAASPLEDMTAHDFKSDPDIRSSYLRTTLVASGASTNL
ncbi:MAG: hypothetical protein KAR20_13640, partial [Candidatus Heimdallarchaeota archaeon]|nr:hypothetical protein [Candidatus Heimdallarchaeota archaeon]